MYKIFLIEDDDKLREHVKEYIEKYGYQVFTVDDFKNVEKEFKYINPDLVLLDINLPYYDGFYLCRVFREVSNIPIIITSARTAEMEQVMGMELGADDYITKPFSLQLLFAKIKACFRRTYDLSKIEITANTNINGLSLNEGDFSINFNNEQVELSKNEFKLLKKLIECKNEIVSREELLEILWDDTQFVDDNTLTVNVTRVKNKLKVVGIKNIIKTKRGAGYMFDSNAIDLGTFK